MDLACIISALQLFLIVPGIIIAYFSGEISSEFSQKYIKTDANGRMRASRYLFGLYLVLMIMDIIYCGIGGLAIYESCCWFDKNVSSIRYLTIFFISTSILLFYAEYHLYRNVRFKLLDP
jgi:hypothetical protein